MVDLAQAPLNPAAGYGKLIAGTAASTVSGAVTTVVITILVGLGVTVGAELHGAIQTLVTAGITGLAIWLTPHGA